MGSNGVREYRWHSITPPLHQSTHPSIHQSINPSIHQSNPRSRPRRLIINADDFGRSAAINQAVIRAHREGVLTSASLMVNEPAFDEAVQLARENPKLGVGLHLTLLCG